MSSIDEPKPRAGSGGLAKLFAALGVVSAGGLAAMGASLGLSAGAKDCVAHGQPALLCAAGSLGLVDLASLTEKDRRIEALGAQVAAKEAAASDLDKRNGELEARVKALDGDLAAARAAAAEVDRLKGEVARRDAKIAELTEKLAAPTRRVEPVPVPAPRPAAPAAPAGQKPPKP